MNVGFIGLGIMGRPMAGHLLRGGHALYLHSRSGVPDELLRAGGIACGAPREVAERAEVVITMVPDTPHVEAVLFGPGLGGVLLVVGVWLVAAGVVWSDAIVSRVWR